MVSYLADEIYCENIWGKAYGATQLNINNFKDGLMKKKHIIIGSLIAIMITLTIGITVYAGWQGPWWDFGSHDIDCDPFESTGDVMQYAEWKLNWDAEEQAYTQYELQNDSYGYIYVDDESVGKIVRENVQIYEYDNSLSYGYFWYDYVEENEFWKEYWPGTDVVLTKPVEGTDVTRTHWWFWWNHMQGEWHVCDVYAYWYDYDWFEYLHTLD
jgi:hypothetical protein